MTHINTDNYPHIKDVMRDAISGYECRGRKFESYYQFNAEDKANIIAALIQDTPEMDQGELFYDPATKHSLFDNLTRFVRSESYADLLRKSLIKTIETNHLDWLISFTEQVINELESEQREYERQFIRRLNASVEREMGIR